MDFNRTREALKNLKFEHSGEVAKRHTQLTRARLRRQERRVKRAKRQILKARKKIRQDSIDLSVRTSSGQSRRRRRRVMANEGGLGSLRPGAVSVPRGSRKLSQKERMIKEYNPNMDTQSPFFFVPTLRARKAPQLQVIESYFVSQIYTQNYFFQFFFDPNSVHLAVNGLSFGGFF